jgi:hypothetical protein
MIIPPESLNPGKTALPIFSGQATMFTGDLLLGSALGSQVVLPDAVM